MPVHDEAALLPTTLPPLLREVVSIGAELVVVCNGCTDDSAALARSLVGDAGRVIALREQGKGVAFRRGEALVSGFPRFFVDADIVLGPGCLAAMCEALDAGNADLVAPVLRIDAAGGSRRAAAVSAVWLALPHMSRDGFHNVLGMSARGRGGWDAMPDLMADDAFIVSRIPERRRAIVRSASATLFPPRTLRSWIGVRRRWTVGHAELRALGLSVPESRGQRHALLRLLLSRRAPAAATFLAVALAARLPLSRPARWYQDRTTRQR